MTTKNKMFLKKKLPHYIKLVSGLSLAIGSAGFALQSVAQAAADEQVEEVIVSGQRASIQSAQDIKKNSNVVVDSIVAEDIGKLPDRSVTEALQRVPGVTVGRYTNNDAEHPAAEGSGVAVRGLSQVRAELNGRDVFSAASGRGLSFEDVPAELMYAVDTYKSPSADMIEGGLGGTVNLRTRMPFDSDGQLASVSVKANYGDQLKETNGEYSGLYSNRWETGAGDFGVLVNASTSDLSSRSDQVYTRPFLPRTIDGENVWVSKGVDWRRNDYESTREGSYLALQWAPNDATEVYFTAFQSKHDTTYDENAFFLEGANGDQALFPTAEDDWGYDENGALQSGSVTVSNPAQWGLDFGTSTRWANNVSKTTDYSTGIKWSPDDHWKFSADLQFVEAEATVDDYTLGLKVIPEEAYMDGIGTKTPSILLDPEYMADFSNYSLGQEMTHFERNSAEAKTGRFDAEYDFDDSVIKSVKAGMRYSEKTADNINTGYDWNTRYATWFSGYDKNTLPKVTADQASKYLTAYSFDDFQRGDVDVPAIGYLYSADATRNFRATTDAINSTCPSEPFSWACNDQVYIDWNRLKNPEYRNTQDEKTVAAYMMANYAFDDIAMPIDGNIGVRVVQTDLVADGFLISEQWQLPNGGAVIAARTVEAFEAKTSHNHVLPSFNLRMRATDDLFIRFAASKAIWSPSFGDTQGKIIITHSVRSGVNNPTINDYNHDVNIETNPYLAPMEANQFDLSAEWYFDDAGGMAHFALFRKDIEGFFRKNSLPYSIESITGGDYNGGLNYSGNAIYLQNIGSGDINGVEIGVSKFFDFLPEPFNGFGVQANYTYIDSEADVPLPSQNGVSGAAPIDTDKTRYGSLPIDQLSKNAFNIVGMYEKDGLSARLAYSWRSKYLIAWGGNGFNPDFPDWSGKASIPVYNDDYGQLDASVSYTFLDNYTVTAEASNLLKEKTVGIIDQNGAGDHVAYSYAQDARFAIGLRAKF
ncbi:TonB-dependent receptor [Cellvibrio sp. KY-GH-1]|uniref:TonB-dependent receptor n=1 Tax=Cellvibrio sp. KY-GH-1 TaxID=2303332 RepID=UPI0012481BC2|nr:TonB-dependent receptor [Cellvibrio sp. KY-GH-1]QEY16517.1 TonB-dependent receptor [Cellvibrio sp. KY-GH-1]